MRFLWPVPLLSGSIRWGTSVYYLHGHASAAPRSPWGQILLDYRVNSFRENGKRNLTFEWAMQWFLAKWFWNQASDWNCSLLQLHLSFDVNKNPFGRILFRNTCQPCLRCLVGTTPRLASQGGSRCKRIVVVVPSQRRGMVDLHWKPVMFGASVCLMRKRELGHCPTDYAFCPGFSKNPFSMNQ